MFPILERRSCLKKNEHSEKGLVLYFSCLLEGKKKKKSVLNYDLRGGGDAWKAPPEE